MKDCFYVIDKPVDCTSFDIVNKSKYLLKEKVGHSGTLDPFATGILPIATGKATRVLEYILEKDKSYEFTIDWGIQTDTLDITGKIEQETCKKTPTKEDLLNILPSFIGSTMQAPPIYSALKINGQKACNLARAGKKVELEPRKVTIYSLELLSHNNKQSSFRTHCAKGTYIRSLARDIAHKLNTLATVSILRRIQVSSFENDNLIVGSEIFKSKDSSIFTNKGYSINSVLSFMPKYELNEEEYQKIKVGVKIVQRQTNDLLLKSDSAIRAIYNKDLIAILLCDEEFLKPKKVLI